MLPNIAECSVVVKCVNCAIVPNLNVVCDVDLSRQLCHHGHHSLHKDKQLDVNSIIIS